MYINGENMQLSFHAMCFDTMQIKHLGIIGLNVSERSILCSPKLHLFN